MKFPYETSFSCIVKPIVSAEKDKYLALASLAEVSSFIPNVDTSKNLDLLPVSFNACVINRVNKNGDVIDTQTALGMYKEFVNKPINVEHNRQKVIGVILNAGFSEFGTDKPLTEEQVKTMDTPFNVTLGGVIWRIVCPALADSIEDASDPTSDKYQQISASWELGFTEYKVAVLKAGQKNLKDAKIIDSEASIKKVENYLKALGGDGKKDDDFYYRMPSNAVLPLGIGFTENPAAEVKGVATTATNTDTTEYRQGEDKTLNTKDKELMTKPSTPSKEGAYKLPANIKKYLSTPLETTINAPDKPTFATEELNLANQYLTGLFDKYKNKTINDEQFQNEVGCSYLVASENFNKIISQSKKTPVKINMKINSIADITDDSLKQATASSISDFISSEIKKGNDTWVTEKGKMEKTVSEASETIKNLNKKVEELTANVNSLSAEKEERAKIEKFNSRMSEISELYAFDDEARAEVTSDIKAIASDEDFAKWKAKAAKLFKGFAKKKDDDDDDGDESKAKINKIAQDDKKSNDKAKASKKEKGHDEEMGAKADDADGDGDDTMAKKKAKASQAAASTVDKALDNADKEKGGITNTSSSATNLIEKYKSAFASDQFIVR